MSVAYLTPHVVNRYILQHGLYQNTDQSTAVTRPSSPTLSSAALPAPPRTLQPLSDDEDYDEEDENGAGRTVRRAAEALKQKEEAAKPLAVVQQQARAIGQTVKRVSKDCQNHPLALLFAVMLGAAGGSFVVPTGDVRSVAVYGTLMGMCVGFLHMREISLMSAVQSIRSLSIRFEVALCRARRIRSVQGIACTGDIDSLYCIHAHQLS